jgi:WD40 repeat protein
MSSSSGVHSVDISVSDSTCASGHMDGVIRIWSIRDHKMVREVKGLHDEVVTGVAYHPDGS